MQFNVNAIRSEFPGLLKKVHENKNLIYFDNAATTQKPRSVIQATVDYYQNSANIHRGIHFLAEKATFLYENTRKAIANYLGGTETEEIIFTSGTTESINLLASCFRNSNLIKTADEIILSSLEHHSNIVPWQILAK